MRKLLYGALCAGLFCAGASVGSLYERNTNTAAAEQRAEAAESRLDELQRDLGRYSTRLGNGRITRLNPDMSVTVSGISGETTSDMDAKHYRMSLRR